MCYVAVPSLRYRVRVPPSSSTSLPLPRSLPLKFLPPASPPFCKLDLTTGAFWGLLMEGAALTGPGTGPAARSRAAHVALRATVLLLLSVILLKGAEANGPVFP